MASRSSMSKRVIRSSVDRLFSTINARIDRIDRIITQLSQQQDASFNTIDKKLNDLQKQLLARLKNSEFVKVSENEILAKIFSGAKMYLDPRDIGLVPHLLLDGDWERDITQAWLTVVKPKDVILDIGANFGYFGVLGVQQSQRDCKVIMFEANPNLIPYLQKTITVNSFQNVCTIENIAVSDKKGEVTLNVLKDYIASSSIKDVNQLNKYNQNGADFELEESIKVKADTIDEYCRSHDIKTVNLIKMDIEGYEENAYAGMRKIIKASPNATLFIEFTKDAYKDPKGFYEVLMQDFGNVYQIDSDGTIRRPAKNNYDTVIGKSNNWSMPIFSKNKRLI